MAGTAVRPAFQELSTLPLFLPLVPTTSTSVLRMLDEHHQESRTVSLKTQVGPLPLLVTPGSPQSQGQHILTLNCTFRSEVVTPQCSNIAHSSVVINLISHVNQPREVSIFKWLLFSFLTQEIKLITG